MKQKEKRILNDFFRDILKKIRSEISGLVVEYLSEKDGVVNSFKLQKLRLAFEECDGNGDLLLPASHLCRVKFFENQSFSRPAFVVPIRGAEDFLAVFDCRTRRIQIEEVPQIVPKAF